jgi:nicotinamidase/pyrazinamidase
VRFDQDQYSVFDQTGLLDELKRRGVQRVWIGGLAQDVCVLASALDARRGGLVVHVIKAATRLVSTEGGARALQQLRDAGIVIEED